MTLDKFGCAVAWTVGQSIKAGLGPFRQLPDPIGSLTRAVTTLPWMKHHPVILHNDGTTMSPAFMLGTGGAKAPTFVLDFVQGSPSKHTQYISHPWHQNTRIVVALQLSVSEGDPLGDSDRLACAARRSSVWVWYQAPFGANSYQTKAIVSREPLSTPDGHIHLWLSDLVHEPARLPPELIRPNDGG